jgi:ubiquinone biosynthesis protein
LLRLLRLLRIVSVALRFGLEEFLFAATPSRVAVFVEAALPRRKFSEPRAARLRQALEALGPIFVKFGQMLSTRRDLLPEDIADELAKLQDQVPPFPAAQARAEIEQAFGCPIETAFSDFEAEPVASASVAQVHFAVLREGPHAGTEVALKILRPGIAPLIEKDIALLDIAAWLIENSPSTCTTNST